MAKPDKLLDDSDSEEEVADVEFQVHEPSRTAHCHCFFRVQGYDRLTRTHNVRLVDGTPWSYRCDVRASDCITCFIQNYSTLMTGCHL